MTYSPLIFWMTLAFGLCLMPGPNYWQERLGAETENAQRLEAPGAVGDELNAATSSSTFISTVQKWGTAFFSEHLKNKERLGHVIPMIGVSFCLSGLLQARRWRWCLTLLTSLLCVFCIALSIELLQETLPEWFHRGFAWDDIGFGLLGGVIGGAALPLVKGKRFTH